MRKQRHLCYWLGALLALLLLALLLSALVEAPLAPAPATADAPPAAARLLPALPLTPESAAGWRSLADALRLFAMALFAAPVLPPLALYADRNGRVLRAGSYVKSFYPIFRQELACG
jgi:hypothetical protein